MLTKRHRSGFTLAEILVTVTVIAVLSAVVVPAVVQYTNKGDTPASQEDIQQIQNAVTGFTADIRRYPGDLQQLVTSIVSSSGSGDTLYKDASAVVYSASDVLNWKGPYTAAPITTSLGNPSGGGLFTSKGLNFTVGRAITLSGGWLRVPVTSPTSCPALLKLDLAIDGKPATTGAENAEGLFVWDNGGTACAAATPGGTFSNLYFRLIPAH
jgi:prepilin-type N-terminal cleavage/methylation domain-containing protein